MKNRKGKLSFIRSRGGVLRVECKNYKVLLVGGGENAGTVKD